MARLQTSVGLGLLLAMTLRSATSLPSPNTVLATNPTTTTATNGTNNTVMCPGAGTGCNSSGCDGSISVSCSPCNCDCSDCGSGSSSGSSGGFDIFTDILNGIAQLIFEANIGVATIFGSIINILSTLGFIGPTDIDPKSSFGFGKVQ